MLLLLACAAPHVLALPSDREQPIEIESDSAERDDTRGVSVYQGNVVYTQGTIRLEADEVRIFEDENRRVTRVEADGSPVRFRQRIEGHDQDMRAHARRIEYFADPERLVLQTDAHVWRLDTELSAELINYDPVRDVVNAERGSADNGRVRIVIQPREGGNPPAPTAGE
ncbi:MAG: lipopolysaccharide transport periplasmic protein LptA [Gammaproteobacteria bacterium]|nr:lipopolysaccharide transport periplasmic protein LptA [Gammaproteobacteria bacterium]